MLICTFISNPRPCPPITFSTCCDRISEMALMYFLWLSTISCYVRYLSGDFRLKNRLHWELSLRSGPVWFFSSLSIAVVHSTVFFLCCLVCLYKIFTLKPRMLQIYPLVAHVIFHENPVKYRGGCLGFVWVGFFVSVCFFLQTIYCQVWSGFLPSPVWRSAIIKDRFLSSSSDAKAVSLAGDRP